MTDPIEPSPPMLPAMSVVVITPDRYDTVAGVLHSLNAQTVKHQLEIVIVAPSPEVIAADAPELQGFMALSVVAFPEVSRATAAARAAAVRAARAPLVAFAEDHSFPQPGWAQALLAAHRGPYAAVGPAIGNANPASVIGWANLLIEYAPWLNLDRAQPVEHLPGHNSSYKREVLLEYGPRLESMLEAESILHWDLRARGMQLWLEPAARTLHMNFTTLGPSIRLRLHGGRLFAAARARGWPIRRRLLYAAAAPIIPLVRFFRIVRQMRAARHPSPVPAPAYPIVLFLLICDAAGEFTGYIMGAGAEAQRAGAFEFNADRRPSPPRHYESAGS